MNREALKPEMGPMAILNGQWMAIWMGNIFQLETTVYLKNNINRITNKYFV